MASVPESFWRLGSAQIAMSKAKWACRQTWEFGRKKTIINVDEDEALVIFLALVEYIVNHRKEYETNG